MFALAIIASLANESRSQDAIRLPSPDFMANRQETIPPGFTDSREPPPPYGEFSPRPQTQPQPGGVPQPAPFASGPAAIAPPLIGPPVTQGGIAMGFGPSCDLPWTWQLLPTGLMYRSYLAGVKEPRIGTGWMTSVHGPFKDQSLTTIDPGTVWDSTLGGRVGLLRYGTPNAYRPEGFQVDLTGSAQPRLNPFGSSTPLLSCDYTIGLPVTYARGRWQYKTGYNHLSSHMGDEIMINNPAYIPQRINYVRDSIMLGVGFFATDAMRLFGEVDYALGKEGGAEPIELQFGIDWSPAHPGGAPFWAIYTNLRQDFNFGGFFVAQAGWQWRGGMALSTFRIGFEYFNGKSPQWETFNQFEQRVGWGIWYDF